MYVKSNSYVVVFSHEKALPRRESGLVARANHRSSTKYAVREIPTVHHDTGVIKKSVDVCEIELVCSGFSHEKALPRRESGLVAKANHRSSTKYAVREIPTVHHDTGIPDNR
uniref:Uncharacterized protein n=1 Tax=Mucochytrium quahogii TaxID=96639 RepID=A0A7S2WGF4_9STRA|mmetsp:Transcript_6183/g.10607  ORF Transcript_6183/g.10607 Transcript_6183/m.10607 type:complete len:112 (+) Transcript_6183:360-695(+)